MFQKIFIVVEVTSPNGTKSYYGKKKKEIPVNDENFGWYMKEYGCDSIEEASKLERQLELYFKKLDIKWRGMDLKDCKVLFTDEDAERFGFKPCMSFY